MSGHDAFISYCSQDKAVADTACAALEARGLRCWIAPRDIRPAQDWSEAIIDALAECGVFLLILSAASNQSEQVKREVQNAVSEGKPILPFRIEEVALSKHMRYFIGTPHWLDALTPPMERHLQSLADVVSGLVDALPAAAVPPTPPVTCEVYPWDAERPARPAEVPAREAPAREAPAGETSLSPETVAAAGKALAHFLGPVAFALAKRAAKAAARPADLHHGLAEHLATPAEKAEFLRSLTP